MNTKVLSILQEDFQSRCHCSHVVSYTQPKRHSALAVQAFVATFLIVQPALTSCLHLLFPLHEIFSLVHLHGYISHGSQILSQSYSSHCPSQEILNKTPPLLTVTSLLLYFTPWHSCFIREDLVTFSHELSISLLCSL